jgi:X-X-X-Leu-X-X-Gly heptad repeat protein
MRREVAVMNGSRLPISCLLVAALLLAACSSETDPTEPPSDTGQDAGGSGDGSQGGEQLPAGLQQFGGGAGQLATGVGQVAEGLEQAPPPAPAAPTADTPPPAASGDCCSCAVAGGATFKDSRMPFTFTVPAGWQGAAGEESGMVSAIAGPSPQRCANTICPNGMPSMSVSYGTTPDANADTMLQIWPLAMQVAGSTRYRGNAVQFFSPPGAEAASKIGGLKFYVDIGGAKYGGVATFTCGEPGGWAQMRDLFIDSFGDNPESTIPGR